MMKLWPLSVVQTSSSTTSHDIFHPTQTCPVVAMKVSGHNVIYFQVFKNLHELIFICGMSLFNVRGNPWRDVHEDKTVTVCRKCFTINGANVIQ